MIFRPIFLASILTFSARGEFLAMPPGSENDIYQKGWIDFDKDGIANIDEMHNGVGKSGAPDNPHIASPAATVAALNEIQRWFIEETRLGIPVEFTNEGIRGACYRKSTRFEVKPKSKF